MLTITSTSSPATDLGFLLHKHPDRLHTASLPFGNAHVFCPEALERVVFEFARPVTVVVTTPNVEYNVRFETLPSGRMRHADHRFEWTRGEFQAWAQAVASRRGYGVRFEPIGDVDAEVGPPTQMAVFKR